MTDRVSVSFGPFRLELGNEQLWQDQEPCKLTPKAFAVLRYLVEHAGQLVTKEILLDTVWPETVVSEGALSKCVKELRQVLGDKAQAPQYIETVHRRGFRFIGQIRDQSSVVSNQLSVGSPPEPGIEQRSLTTRLVGRHEDLSQLHGWLARALSGQRQLVFASGEAGIEKTSVVEAFLSQLPEEPEVRRGQGQCIEQYGAGEPYQDFAEGHRRKPVGECQMSVKIRSFGVPRA